MNRRKNHILIIDDDREIVQLLEDYLAQNGFRTSSALNGLHIKPLLQKHHFDVIILDIMLPGIDGLHLCQTIRQNHNTPIIMLSAANSIADRVAGLELGADDYISKPFSARELLARVKAQIRRTQVDLSEDRVKLTPLHHLRFDNWILDRNTHSLIDSEEIAVPLSQREYELLLIFLEHPGRILSRDQLMDLLYNKDYDSQDRTIDVLVGRLRKKIECESHEPELLLTIRGGGYQFKGKVIKS